MKRIGSIMNSTLRKFKLDRGIQQIEVLALWENVVGKNIATHSKPIKVRYKVLTVAVDNPIWGSELSLMKDKLIKKLNLLSKSNIIKNITFKFAPEEFK